MGEWREYVGKMRVLVPPTSRWWHLDVQQGVHVPNLTRPHCDKFVNNVDIDANRLSAVETVNTYRCQREYRKGDPLWRKG